MTWVWEHSRSKLSARLVLLAIADHANGDGLDAYPSTVQLMRKTGLSERAVQKAVAELVELGELHVSAGGGRGNTNRYRVLMVERPDEVDEVNPADPAPFENPADPAPFDGNPAQKTPYSGNPAEKTPYSCPETPQSTTGNPAESAPGTKREPRATVKDSPTGSPAPARTRTRGSRIPADFEITDEMRDWATAEATKATQQPPNRETFPDWLDRHTERFRDHWRGASGQRAVKADWAATWRNWIRKEIDIVAQQPPRPGNALARYDPQRRRSTTDERVAQALELAAKFTAEEAP